MQIIVNFKLHKNAIGAKAISLAKTCEKVAQQTGVKIAIAVNPTDIQKIANTVKIPVLAQHIDPILNSSSTGSISAKTLKQSGAVGSLLNHAEKTIKVKNIKETLKQAKEEGLFVVYCTKTPRESKKIANLPKEIKPKIIALEPEKLIGTNHSVTEKEPSAIKKTLKTIGETKLLVGAGIKTANDVKKALDLGAHGVLIASAITKSKSPYSKLLSLANTIKNHKK